MREKTQKEKLEDLMKRPIPRKWVGIVHLNMVKEGRGLYGMKRFCSPEDAVDLVRPMLKQADRELFLVVSMDRKLEPLAIEIAAVGGIAGCHVDVRNIFKHALLNNASYVICFHNYPSGFPEPSGEDGRITERIKEAGNTLGIPLLDHIIIGENGFYSFREKGKIRLEFPDEAA